MGSLFLGGRRLVNSARRGGYLENEGGSRDGSLVEWHVQAEEYQEREEVAIPQRKSNSSELDEECKNWRSTGRQDSGGGR